MILGALLLSYIPVLHWPFAWLQTYYHEISHGLAAIAGGGEISRIVIRLDGSGVCYTRGGIHTLTLVMGYLGSVFWGGVIFFSTRIRSRRAFRSLLLFTCLLLVMTLTLWSEDLVTAAIIAVLIGLIFLQWRMESTTLAKRVFQFLGVYVLIDAIKAPLYLIDGHHRGDGAMLSEITGLPEIFWVLGWTGWALLGLYLVWRSTDQQRAY